MNKEIEKYLKSKNPGYIDGAQLYIKYGRNKNLNRYFSHAESQARKEKLLYELSKIAEVDPPAPPAVKSSPIIKKLKSINPNDQHIGTIHTGDDGKRVPFNTLPLIIQEVIKQKGKLYRKREDLHEQLKKVSKDNKTENKKKREAIAKQINHYAKRIDELYNVQIEYENSKKLPDESILNWDTKPPAVEKKHTDLMPNHAKMSDLDLKNRLTNLRTYITRDENQLEYQSRKKEAKKNPMTDGPKKNKIVKQIELRKAEIKVIEEILNKKNKKGSK